MPGFHPADGGAPGAASEAARTTREFATAGRLAMFATLFTFLLIVVGSVVRTTGSGLACPDWPLCEGRILPRWDPHVLIEWTHRTLALCLSLLLVATAAWVLAHRAVRARLGGPILAALGLIALQVLLGALTVWKLLHPSVVSSHLAVALLLFATLVSLSLAASREGDAGTADASRAPARPNGLLALTALAATLTFAQAVLGGVVSTSHAGLACPDWPTCDGEWFPPLRGLVGLQMAHRWGAYLLILVVAATAVRARQASDPGVRMGAGAALLLVVVQAVLGVCNVLLATPPWLVAAHIATAVAMLGILVATTHRVAALPARTLAFAAP